MPAHRALRELERRAQLTDRQLLPLQGKEEPAPRGVGEGRESVVDGERGCHIRISGWIDNTR